MFHALSRQRIELRPLQRRDVREESKGINYPQDWLVWIIEHLDSEYIKAQVKKLKEGRK